MPRSVEPAMTAAGAENQLLLQAGFVEPDDFAAVVRPAHVVVSVLTPMVFKLQGHPGVRGEKLLRVCRNVVQRANLRLAAVSSLPPKPHRTTNFRSSRYGGVFAETVKLTPPY